MISRIAHRCGPVRRTKRRGSEHQRPFPCIVVLCCWALGFGLVYGPRDSYASEYYPAADGKAVLALVRDAPGRFEDSGFLELVLRYLRELAGDDYAVEVENRYVGDDTTQGIESALHRALNDPRVEVVFGGGMVVSELGARLSPRQRHKPFFAGFPELSDRQPRGITEAGASAIPNYTFVSTPYRVVSDLRMLRKITGTKRIYGLIPAGIFELYDDWEEELALVEERVGASVIVYPVEGSVEDVLRQLPPEAEAVYVGVLPKFTTEMYRQLFAALRKRGIFNLGMQGRPLIDLGATASLSPDLRDPLARRAAVNLHQLFLGFGTDELQVHLPSQDQLVINAEVMRSIGWSPDYETYLTADFINERSDGSGQPITLQESMQLAAQRNPDARAARAQVNIAEADTRIARSALLPSFDLDAQHSIARNHDRIVPAMTPSKQHAGAYGLTLRQVLFDDEYWSQFRAQRFNYDAARLNAYSSELDARANGGIAFLQVLLAESLFGIEKENLRLSERNLRLAKTRVDVGAADPSEVFRWESQVARGRADLVQREAQRDNAIADLNRVLDADRDKRWSVTPMVVDTDRFDFLGRDIAPLIRNTADMARLATFLQILATESSPELAAFDASLEAQGVLLGQKKRKYFLPTIGLQGSYTRSVLGSAGTVALDGTRTNLKTDAQNELVAGVVLSLPLYQGGRRRADIDRQRASIRQLQAQRQSAVQSLRRNAVTALNNLSADHANILLSERAQAAARKNFESVREKYSQGAATILDLLDAQSGLLQQRQQVASASYTFLIDSVSLQRATTWFDATKSEAERQRWSEELERFLRSPDDDPGRQ